MGKYGTLFTKIWTDTKFRKMEERDRLLFMYLLSSTHLNMLGLYYIPVPYMAYDLGWDCAETEKRLNNLIEHKVVKYDFGASVVFIINYLKYNQLQNPNQVKGAGKVLAELPDTILYKDLTDSFNKYNSQYANMFSQIISNMQTILKGFQNTNQTVFPIGVEENYLKQQEDDFRVNENFNTNKSFTDDPEIPPFLDTESLFTGNETVNQGFINSSETVSKSVTVTEAITKTEDNNISSKKTRSKKKNSKDVNLYKNEFEIFFNEYPRKEGKTAGYNNFVKVLNNNKNITPQDLIDSAKKYYNICKRDCREMKFIKLPSTFLGKDESYKDFITNTSNPNTFVPLLGDNTTFLGSNNSQDCIPSGTVGFEDIINSNPSFAQAVNDLCPKE